MASVARTRSPGQSVVCGRANRYSEFPSFKSIITTGIVIPKGSIINVMIANPENKRLARYFRIQNAGALPLFNLSRRVAIPDDYSHLSIPEMWNLHDRLTNTVIDPKMESEISSRKVSPLNLMHLKRDLAREIVKSCELCERRCNVDRTKGELGYCRVPYESHYASEFLHVGEEPEIIPSHTIFFAGCTFRCIHCQNSEIIENPSGDYLVDDDLVRRIENRFKRGGRNVNLVGGNPDQHLHNILDVFTKVDVPVPVIWNSNMYHSSESGKLLTGFVDVYLADFKYGPSDCAERISDVKNYWDVVNRNLMCAYKHAEIYIRHLLLPNHVECCAKPIMEWVSQNIPNAKFNLMFQYHPCYRAIGHEEIGRLLSAPEKQRSLELMEEYGINK